MIKLCGLRKPDHAVLAARKGADLIGFVFFSKSPRFITPEAAEDIVMEVKRASEDEGFDPPHFVGLFVDAGEKALAEAAPFLSHFQFHGHESPERVEALGLEFGVETIKALPVGAAEDIAAAREFAEASDFLLFDGKPPKGADRPGGHGAVFDWALLSAYGEETPFLLAGGLTPENAAAAIAAVKGHSAFAGIDVSSGVESDPGVKDAAKIEAFLAKARAAL